MHASSQHTKAEIAIARAKELLADADIFLEKSQEKYQAMKTQIASQEEEAKNTHKKLDDTIRGELDTMTKVADDYFGSFDDNRTSV